MPKSYDRREFLNKSVRAGTAFTVLGAGGMLLDACGGNNSGGTVPNTTLSKTKALQVGVNPPPKSAKLGGSVVFGTEAEESGMDPTYGHFDSTGVLYARCVFDPLAMVTESGQVVPYLAQSITPNSTYTKWQIRMRPNIKFSDGTDCDADAMLFCMEHFQSSLLTGYALNYWETKNAVTKVDDLTIQINMVAPWVSFPAWLCGYIGGQVAYMFSPTAYSAGSESAFSLHPIGTGPFKLKVWDVGSQFVCERNPYYWRKDSLGRQLPYLDSWTYRPMPTVSERLNALQSDSIHMMHTDDDPTIFQVERDKKLSLILDDELDIGEPDCLFAMINTKDSLLKDLSLRQALAYSFNQAEYSKVVGTSDGHGPSLLEGITGPFSKPSPYYGPTGYPAFDLNKAKSLVASWKAQNGGKTPSIAYTTTTGANQDGYTLVQYMMQQAGFKVSVSMVEQASLINDALGGGYQVFAWRQFANIDPDLNYVFWTKAAGNINFARNIDPIIDTAMDTARQTTDQSTRLASYQKVAERFAVDLPYIWAARDVWCVAAQNTVQNWNNPSTPDTPYTRGLSMLSGIIMPTQVWLDSSAS
ncbi:MAG: ABC transporter substrate-binding protein [Acidimicrobiales bacterium]